MVFVFVLFDGTAVRSQACACVSCMGVCIVLLSSSSFCYDHHPVKTTNATTKNHYEPMGEITRGKGTHRTAALCSLSGMSTSEAVQSQVVIPSAPALCGTAWTWTQKQTGTNKLNRTSVRGITRAFALFEINMVESPWGNPCAGIPCSGIQHGRIAHRDSPKRFRMRSSHEEYPRLEYIMLPISKSKCILVELRNPNQSSVLDSDCEF